VWGLHVKESHVILLDMAAGSKRAMEWGSTSPQGHSCSSDRTWSSTMHHQKLKNKTNPSSKLLTVRLRNATKNASKPPIPRHKLPEFPYRLLKMAPSEKSNAESLTGWKARQEAESPTLSPVKFTCTSYRLLPHTCFCQSNLALIDDAPHVD
jgi:hypothetical protein